MNSETSTTLNLTEVPSVDDESEYRLIVTEKVGTVECKDTSAAVTLIVLTAPTITNPNPDTTCVNGAADFMAMGTASESGVLTYQWQKKPKNGSFADIMSETSTTLNLMEVPSGDDESEYRLIVTEKVGTLECKDTSAAATLIVLTAPTITNPSADTTCVNGAADFTAMGTASEGGALTYKWQKKPKSGSFADMNSETNTTLNLTEVPSADDESEYRLIVTERVGTMECKDTSESAMLIVLKAPTITNPNPDTTCVNGAAAFTAMGTASEGGTLSYQWQKKPKDGSFGDVTNETSTTLNLTTVGISEDSSEYRLIVIEKVGSVECKDTSESAMLIVLTAPTVSSQPLNAAICETKDTSFTAAATSTEGGTLSYKWQESTDGNTYTDISNVAPFSDATTTNLKLTNAPTAKNTYRYRMIVFEQTGTITCSDTSNEATLTVYPNPVVTGLTASANDICVNTMATINLSGATSLTDGSYTLTYKVGNGSDQMANNVAFVSGAGSFMVDGLTVGSQTIAITQIQSGNNCAVIITGVSATLTVLYNPSITSNGKNFTNICGTTIDLTANQPAGSTGQWSFSNQNPASSGSISATANPMMIATGVFGGAYTLRWTINSGACSGRFSEVMIDFNPDKDFNGGPDGVQDCVDLCIGGDDGEDSDGSGIPDDCDCNPGGVGNEFIAYNQTEVDAAVANANFLNKTPFIKRADYQLTSTAVIEPKVTNNAPNNYPAFIFTGGHSVILKPGFHAKAGSDFIARQEYCRDPHYRYP
ncbi:MAG: 3-coathanger stack domain-containing protein [Bacteroidota bacterium]